MGPFGRSTEGRGSVFWERRTALTTSSLYAAGPFGRWSTFEPVRSSNKLGFLTGKTVCYLSGLQRLGAITEENGPSLPQIYTFTIATLYRIEYTVAASSDQHYFSVLVARVSAHLFHLEFFCMSDFDFGDALEDAIENRQNTAGFLFAQGAANQRAAQLKSLENQLAVDKKRARTEEERLSVEKRRLEIEEERLVVERDAKISAEALATELRFVRGIMVDIGDELAAIRKGASTMLSGRLDQAITLRVAYVQVLLKLIGDRSHVLCDLGDLKEFRRLGSEFTQVSRECHQKGLSPGDPLQRVVDEIGNLDKWGAAAKALLDRGRWMLRSDLFEEDGLRAGLTRLAAIRVELENFIQTFDGDVERVSRQLPLFCLDGQSLNSSVGVIWELLHENTPWAKWFNPLNESIQGLGGANQWVDKARALQRVVDEIGNLDKWGAAAKALLDRGRWMLRSDLFEEDGLRAGLTRLAAIRVELENFIQTFDGDVERVSRQLPLYCLDGQVLDSSVGLIWELLHENTRWAKWFNSLNESIQGLGAAKQWVDKARAQLAKIGPREALARAEANDLRVALDALASGEPQQARVLSVRPMSERFDAPLWGEFESSMQKMETAYAAVYAVVIKGWNPFKMPRAIQSLRQNVLWADVKPHSEWGVKLNAFELKARRYNARFHETSVVIIFLLVFLPALLTSLAYQRNKILAAETKKAEIESAKRAAFLHGLDQRTRPDAP